jgi:hypothetical protein
LEILREAEAVEERIVADAHDQLLSYPLGLLFRQGHFHDRSIADLKERQRHAERLREAGLRYAALHFAVFNGTGTPRRFVPSHLSKLVVEIVGYVGDDPQKLEAIRQAKERRLAQAREALRSAAPRDLALKIIDRTCLEEAALPPAMIFYGIRYLIAGLTALAELFHLIKPKPADDRTRLTGVPASRRDRLEVVFGPSDRGEIDRDQIQRSVARLLSGRYRSEGVP